MKSFKTRSRALEWMDVQATTVAEFHHCLRTLEKINICTLAYPPTLKWMKAQFSKSRPGRKTQIWDIGSGGGDMLRLIWKLARKTGTTVELTGIDLHPFAERSALQSTPAEMEIVYVVSNIFDLPDDEKTDFIISSLFTHHLTDSEVVRFIRWMEEHTNSGWFINDLHRHPLPYYFIKSVVRSLGLNRLVRHDAPVSVARGFTRGEWEALLKKAGVPLEAVTIRWSFPFRYSVGRVKA
ncbi:methyltransferase domain-containing protein [bacterium]|nr:MAG: methyltransferase domain-containing protein [bacterium]